MLLLSPVLAQMTPTRLAHWCPGCQSLHRIAVEEPLENGAVWRWNENPLAPTFSPSVNVFCRGIPDEGIPDERCHYFLSAGVIRFLPDCTHELAGTEVPLPPIPESWPR